MSSVAPKPDKEVAPAAAAQRGKTFIADDVVSAIARLAAEQVEGVHQIGASTFRAIFSRLGRHHGIESEVGMKEAAIDIDIVVIFGYPIRAVADNLRQEVIASVERMTGRNVVEVNVNVIDVHIPKQEQRPRRQIE